MNEIGVDMAGKLMDYGLSYGLNSQNNKWAAEREHMARLENYRFGEMAANSADARTRALYYDLQSPQALLQQYLEAGLSPSLMFGGGGTGGSVPQGAQGNGAAGISPTVFGMNPKDIAEMDLIRAQASKVREETKTEAGENELGKARISNALAQAGLYKAQQRYQTACSTWQELNNKFFENTEEMRYQQFEMQTEEMNNNAEKSYWDMLKANLDYKFDEETYDNRVSQELDKANKLYQEYLLTASQKELTDQQKINLEKQIEKMTAEIAQGWRQLQIDNATYEAQKKYWDETAKVKLKEFYETVNRDYFNATKGGRSYEGENTGQMLIQGILFLISMAARTGA